MNKVGVLNSSLNTEFQKDADMGHHFVTLESQFKRLVNTAFEVKKPVKVAALITSLSHITELTAIAPLVNK